MGMTHEETCTISLTCDGASCAVSAEFRGRRYSDAVHEGIKTGWVYVQLYRLDGAERHPQAHRTLLCPVCARMMFMRALDWKVR
jgi:hypothetical protein